MTTVIVVCSLWVLAVVYGIWLMVAKKDEDDTSDYQ